MRLIIHAGMHKTGTTTIQRALARDVPHLLAPGDHHYHVWHHTPQAPRPMGALTVFSSESLFPWLDRNPTTAQLWAANIRRVYSDVAVVLFLRRQDELMESIYAEAACRWHHGPFETLDYQFDHAERIATLESLFGAAALRIGIYDGTDILAQFQQLTGISLQPIARHNQRLHRRIVAYMATVPKRDRGKVAQLRERAAQVIANDGEPYLFAPLERLRMLARYCDSNRALCNRWCPDAALYMTGTICPVELSNTWQPSAPLTEEESCGMMID